MSIGEPKNYCCYLEFPNNGWWDINPPPANWDYWTTKPIGIPWWEEPSEDTRKKDYDALIKLLAGKDVETKWISTEANYSIALEVAGFKKEDISIEIKNEITSTELKSVLSIKASRADKKYAGKVKTLTLPKDADESSVSAKLEDGILTIAVSKVVPPLPKKIVIS